MGRPFVRAALEQLEPRKLLAGVAGVLDTKFSFDGKVATDYAGQYDEGNAVAVQANGNIVVAATLSDSAGFPHIGVVRYLGSGANAGELDTTFGTNGTGIVLVPLNGFPTGVAIQPADGKIVVGGTTAGATTDDFTVVRLTTDGLLDPTFGQFVSGTTRAGYVRADFAGRTDSCSAIALQSDGFIVAAGSSESVSNSAQSDFAVARFDANGVLDNTFSPGGTEGSGRAMIDMGGRDVGRGVAIQSNGRILIAGTGAPGANTNATTVAVARLTPVGNLDGNFDTDGRAYLPSAVAADGFAIGLQSDNKIVTLGAPAANPAYMFLSRFNPDGSPAPFPSEPSNVLKVLDGAAGISPGGLFIQRDDRILACAFYDSAIADPKNGFVVLRRNFDGSVDDDFNGGSPNYVNFGPEPDHSSGADAITVAADGKIVASGFTDSGGGITNIAVARFVNNLIAPYNNHFAAVGETMEAEDYNNGGQGVSYFDNTTGNSGNANYRTDESVDIDNIVGGGGRVVTMETDEGVSYAFQVTADASYALQVRLAGFGGGALDATVIPADGPGPSLGDFKSVRVDVPNTGGRFTFVTIHFDGGLHLTPGRYLLGIRGLGTAAPPVDGPEPAAGQFLATLDWFKVINDTFGPQVRFPFYDYTTSPNRLSVQFDEDVTASLVNSAVHVRNLTTGTEFDASGISIPPFDNEFDVDFLLPTPLAKGNYRATLNANIIRDINQNPLDGNGDGINGDNFTFDFFVLPGDANRDRKVDFNDLVKVAQNYNTGGGKTYGQGDFNNDGIVNFSDLVVLAQNYNATLPAPGASVTLVSEPAAAQSPVKAVFNSNIQIGKPLQKAAKRPASHRPAHR